MLLRPAPRAEAVLGHGSGVPVVLDHHRDAEAGLEAVAEIDACERDVHRGDGAPAALVDRRRNADAERGVALARDRVDDALELGQEGLLAREIGGLDRAAEDGPLAVHEPGRQLRPAKIDRDDVRSAHSASGYDTRSLWRRRTSRTALYRGGRAKGPVPKEAPRGRAERGTDGKDAYTRPSRTGPPAPQTSLAADRGHRPSDRPAGVHGLGGARLSRVPQRGQGGERAARLPRLPRPDTAGRARPLEPVDDPRPRHRRGPEPHGAVPLRRDDARPHRPGRAPHGACSRSRAISAWTSRGAGPTR